ncbi:hypothetical protein GCM10010371_29000 [Streptomyces subrutilus]|uniref:Uncharacterized protein n=1 Tax=Streptomyces subrutilus TaxID=36818 RepID=A0A918V487_9ACTN|nr:hypothetical protein GCM10010371_29000 [Streptomyces subrutilus]
MRGGAAAAWAVAAGRTTDTRAAAAMAAATLFIRFLLTMSAFPPAGIPRQRPWADGRAGEALWNPCKGTPCPLARVDRVFRTASGRNGKPGTDATDG